MAERRLRPSPNLAAVLVLSLLATLLWWQQPWRESARHQPVPLPADAPARLTSQLRAISDADTEAEFVAAYGDLPAARKLGRQTWSSMRAVARPGASLRYISGGDAADRADGSATVLAEAQWRPSASSGLDPSVTHRSTIRLRIAPQTDGSISIVGVTGESGSVPLWLVGPVSVATDDGRSVLRIGGADADLAVEQMVERARATVERSLPAVSGELTIISPSTQAQMAAVLGQDTRAIAQIAAVTTALDVNSSTEDVVVVLNPVLFAAMDERAAQIVLTHEATHALTRALGTPADNWVIEGFADWVALRADTAPLSVSAGQALAEVKAGRLPDRLPSDEDFESTREGLAAVYESTWLIFKLLGDRYGDAAVVSFYESALRGTGTDVALRSAFGIGPDQLTARWRTYLTKSASTVS